MSNTALVKNVYYNAFAYNSGIANIDSTQDAQLLYDLLPAGDSQNYQLAIAKLRTSLTAIPMTTTNIPLKQYQLILRNTVPSGTGTKVIEAAAYVRQINSNTNNFVYSLSGTTLNSYIYTSTSISTLVRSIELGGVCQYIYNYVLDDYLNVYIAGSNSNPNNADTLFICDGNITPNVLQTLTYNNLTSLYIDRNQKLYIADDGVGNGVVYVYFNNNGENTVSLTPQGTIRTSFTALEITNITFVVATDNTIIVGHDKNVITFYNQQLNAISQFIEQATHQIRAANVLNSNNTLIISDANQYADTLYGTLASGAIANIETNQTLTGTTAVSAMACTNAGVGFIAGGDQATYYITLPITPVAGFTLLNSSTAVKTIITNKNGIYAIGVNNTLYTLNMNGNANNWFQSFGGFEISTGGGVNAIISMDYNVNTDQAVAVDSANNLWQSKIPILPINFMYYYQDTVITQGTSFNNIDSVGRVSNRIVNTSTIIPYIVSMYQYGGNVYTIEGVPGSQVVVQRSFADYSMGLTGTTYTLAETLGTMTQICVFNTWLVVLDGNKVFRTYTLGTNTEVAQSGLDFVDVNNLVLQTLDGVNSLIIGADNIIHLLAVQTYALEGSNIVFDNLDYITSVAVNTSDVENGCYACFITSVSGSSSACYKIVWNTGYAGLSSQTLITSTNAPATITSVACNSYYSQLYIFANNDNIGEIFIYQQSDNYANFRNFINTNVPQYFTPGSGGFVYVPNNGSNPYTWVQQTSNIQLKSVAVSRSNSNTLYAINNSNNITYYGTLNNNAITFTQESQFVAQTYNYISTTINKSTNIDSILRTYTINNQAALATTTINGENITSIARNEQLRQYVIPLKNTNQIASYNDALVQQYTNALNAPFDIFVKNGADTDAGPYSIYDLSLVIASINIAFSEAYSNIVNAQGGNLAEAPYLTLDINGLLTLNYSNDYPKSGNAILFNNPLEQLCYFTATPDTIDTGFFNLFLTGVSTSQLNKSMYIFNQLDKIQIASQSLFVNGQFFGINSFSQVITDIDVPIDQFPNGNVGQILYYQPNFLRVFQLTSGGNPVNRIQLSIYYAYRNGTVAVVPLVPGESFSATLEFVKKF